MAGERLLDGVALGAAAAFEVRVRREQHSRRAEAALGGVVLVECRLYRRERFRRAEALRGRDVDAFHRRDGREARPTGRSVDEDGARSTTALLAACLRARDPELLAEHVEERGQRAALDLVLDAVDDEVHPASPSCARARLHEHRQRPLPVPGGRERVVGERHIREGGLAGGLRVGGLRLGRRQPDGVRRGTG